MSFSRRPRAPGWIVSAAKKAVAGLLGALVVSCTAGGSAGQAPAPATSAVAPDYTIGPGDGFQYFVWRNPELTVTVPVRPDGRVSTPLNEDMVAVGKTPSVLARD